MTQKDESPAKPLPDATENQIPVATVPLPPEFGGRKGLEATRFGDWEMNGKCVDF